MIEATYDYVVIGSGAGGGTVAARLAEAGMRVLVLEAGPDPGEEASYEVPAFHPLATEDPQFCWNQPVRHFDAPDEARADDKADAEGNILYPRAGALGGCTAHNAMIFLVPPDEDWDWLARHTGDAGWSAKAMRRHRRSVEQCRHRPLWRILAFLGINPTGHGWRGWLPVEKSMPLQALADAGMIRTLFLSALVELGRGKGLRARLRAFFQNWGDPNDVRRGGCEQLCYLPLSTDRHARSGTRERLRAVAARHPGRLDIQTDALATRIIFDEAGRAAGVDWLKGRHLHRASPVPSLDGGRPMRALATCEVIVAAGAFATPQILMLSGIGDPARMAPHGIASRAVLPEVGRNLQDRYEISLVNRMAGAWSSMRGADFSVGDGLYRRWQGRRRGMYVSNGAALTALRRSSRATGDDPDLVLMGLIGRFRGYYPGYSRQVWPGHDGFSWVVLKGRTGNRAGSVSLASADPRDRPVVSLRNFAQNGDADLDALVEGLGMARDMTRPLVECGAIAEEEVPGRDLQGAALRQWVRSNAWGHHACGTAAIGPVLDPQGRVHGVAGLRVVDASIFPRIPGLFLVAAIYLAAEKLAADILADGAKGKD
ncbi:GMC family oxidoreductase [Novosphingobium sp. BL-52-GroH]|uniref:GMC family oxidoreductase n=1 Tax=Novosphingobium sp. BL-52-GroH TaxID=3349877 RepID=UPI00384C1AA5